MPSQQQIIDEVLKNKAFKHCLCARLRDTRLNPYSSIMKLVQTQMELALHKAEETMDQFGLNFTELEKVDTFFRATVQFIRAWKRFRQAFSKNTVDRVSLMPELHNADEFVSSAVRAVDNVLADVVLREKEMSADRMLAILSSACRQSFDNSWSSKERRIYEVASQTFNAATEVWWAVTIERILCEVKRLLPAVRQKAEELDLLLTEGWLLVYTVFFLFPPASYEEEGQEKEIVLPVISDELTDEFRQTLHQIDLSSAISIGNDLFQVVNSLMEQVRQPNGDEDALLDVCYSFCHGIVAEQFRKEQKVSEAAYQVLRHHGLTAQEDINSTVVASNAFADALQRVYDKTKELPIEKVLSVILNACYQERKTHLDFYETEWEEIAMDVDYTVRPYLAFYDGALSRYRKNRDEAFQNVYLWIKEALQAASQKAVELQLNLPPNRLVSLTITHLR